MKSEYVANMSLQTQYVGKPLIVNKQEKYATIGTMLQNYLIKFAALVTLAIAVKHFI